MRYKMARGVKPKRHRRKAKVSGVSSKDSSKRFKDFISEEFNSRKVPDRGEYVVLHERMRLEDKHDLDVIVYTTDTIYISASPFLPLDTFNRIATRIVQLAQQSTKPLEEIRPLSILRAKNILSFALQLNLDDEYQRMVIMILADTSNEIVLTEQMKAAGFKGSILDEGVPVKIKKLKEKQVAILNEKGIRNLREIRNRVVHQGDIPDRSQGEEALRIAQRVLKSVSKE